MLIGNDPRIEAWERELKGWRLLCEDDGWIAWDEDGFRIVGPFPRFQDAIDAALAKDRQNAVR